MAVGDKPASRLGLKALLDFQLEIVLNGEVLTEDELQAIIHSTAGLQMIKGKWVEADPAELARLLADYQRIQQLATQSGLSILDLFRLQLYPEKVLSGLQAADKLEITQGEWLARHLSRLSQKRPAESPQNLLDPGENFKAQLRPYQQTGLQWLTEMTSWVWVPAWPMTWDWARPFKSLLCSMPGERAGSTIRLTRHMGAA